MSDGESARLLGAAIARLIETEADPIVYTTRGPIAFVEVRDQSRFYRGISAERFAGMLQERASGFDYAYFNDQRLEQQGGFSLLAPVRSDPRLNGYIQVLGRLLRDEESLSALRKEVEVVKEIAYWFGLRDQGSLDKDVIKLDQVHEGRQGQSIKSRIRSGMARAGLSVEVAQESESRVAQAKSISASKEISDGALRMVLAMELAGVDALNETNTVVSAARLCRTLEKGLSGMEGEDLQKLVGIYAREADEMAAKADRVAVHLEDAVGNVIADVDRRIDDLARNSHAGKQGEFDGWVIHKTRLEAIRSAISAGDDPGEIHAHVMPVSAFLKHFGMEDQARSLHLVQSGVELMCVQRAPMMLVASFACEAFRERAARQTGSPPPGTEIVAGPGMVRSLKPGAQRVCGTRLVAGVDAIRGHPVAVFGARSIESMNGVTRVETLRKDPLGSKAARYKSLWDSRQEMAARSRSANREPEAGGNPQETKR